MKNVLLRLDKIWIENQMILSEFYGLESLNYKLNIVLEEKCCVFKQSKKTKKKHQPTEFQRKNNGNAIEPRINGPEKSNLCK